MSLPRVMRVPRTLKHGHYYIDPTGIEIYAHGPASRLRLTRRQLEQILKVMYDYVPNRSAKP